MLDLTRRRWKNISIADHCYDFIAVTLAWHPFVVLCLCYQRWTFS